MIPQCKTNKCRTNIRTKLHLLFLQNHTMSSSFMDSIFNLIFPCLNFTDGFRNDDPNSYRDEQSCTSDSSSAAVSELPDSVVLEILLRLPIKTVIRCRCVSKSWYNLTHDPYFARTYFTNPPFTAIAFNYENHFNFLEIGTSCDVIRTCINPNAIALPKAGTSLIRGSCHGLLCVVQSTYTEYRTSDCINATYNEEVVYIFNPLQPELLKILPPVEKAKRITCDVVYAFGCSANGDCYKVARIVSSYEGDQNYFQTHGEIVTIGVDKGWRILEDSSLSLSVFDLFPGGVGLNGIVHLVGEVFTDEDEDADDDDDSTIGFIFAFDIAEEKGHRIMFPPGTADVTRNIKLTVCDDKLCFADNGNQGRVDIWMMKEYGVVESWSKEIILKTQIPADIRHSQFIPVATLWNGDLLMSRVGDTIRLPCPEHLIRFDRRTKTITRLEVSFSVFSTSFLFQYTPRFFPQKYVTDR